MQEAAHVKSHHVCATRCDVIYSLLGTNCAAGNFEEMVDVSAPDVIAGKSMAAET